MGLATLPSASEGVLCIILVNTAVPFSFFKFIIRALLLMVGVQESAFTSVDHSTEDDSYVYSASSTTATTTGESYVEEFRSRTPAVRFDSISTSNEEAEQKDHKHNDGQVEEDECSVCLTGFQPESQVNHLSCGHMFHKVCLEQWLDYWNIACPLCRTPLVSPEEDLCAVW